MKVVFLKHTANGKKLLFEVPERLAPDIHNGVRVRCDTQFGRKTGKIVGSVMDGADAENAMKEPGVTFPLRKIISIRPRVQKAISIRPRVQMEMPVSRIKIPEQFAQAFRSKWKVYERMNEYRKNGQFSTKVVVSPDGTLMDGYATYLAARELKLPKIRVCLSGQMAKTKKEGAKC